MTFRPISQINLAQIGKVKLVGLVMAVLMIATVACATDTAAGQPAPDDSGATTTAPTAVSDSTGGNSDQGQDSEAGSGSSSSGATAESTAPEAVATETAADEAIEQATGALFLEMISPDSDELFVSQNSYEFAGRTTVDALVSVNDFVLDVDEQGRFAFDMTLEEGPNLIEVVASNALGEQFDEVLLVIYEPV